AGAPAPCSRTAPRCPRRRACCAPTGPPPGCSSPSRRDGSARCAAMPRRWAIRCAASFACSSAPSGWAASGWGPAVPRPRLSWPRSIACVGGTLRLYCVGSTDRSASGAFMNLDDWRSRINNLDHEILALLNQRADAALHIGELKRQQDLPYFVPEREAQVLDRLVTLNRGPLPADALRAI